VSYNKIGLHIVEGFSGRLCGPTGNPPVVVKLLDPSLPYVAQVRAEVGPDCLIIVRWFEAHQGLDAPALNAAQWFGAHLPQLQALAAFKPLAVEGYNEIPDHQAAAYCEFEIARLKALHGIGLQACVGNFSVGTPDLPVWQTYQPMLDAMGPGDYLGVHEYWANRNGLSNPWHTGRWRLVPELDGVPIVVTETGRDVVQNEGHAGWKGQVSENEYLDELREYGRLLDQFPNVLGATVFTGGRIYDQWKDFDVNDIWPRVVAEYPERSPKPTPDPEPVKPPVVPPVPPQNGIGPGFPRIERVCFPMKNTGKPWYESTRLYGKYDGHPDRAEDYNLESMGNTDLGEPLIAPFRGVVTCAKDYKGAHGRVLAILGVDQDGTLTVCRMKHLQRFTTGIKPGVWVECGQDVGTIGNADGYYSGAHLHLEIVKGAVPGPIESWQNEAYEFVQPSWWLLTHGVDAATVERVTRKDKK
jgi:hypothetical protein